MSVVHVRAKSRGEKIRSGLTEDLHQKKAFSLKSGKNKSVIEEN